MGRAELGSVQPKYDVFIVPSIVRFLSGKGGRLSPKAYLIPGLLLNFDENRLSSAQYFTTWIVLEFNSSLGLDALGFEGVLD